MGPGGMPSQAQIQAMSVRLMFTAFLCVIFFDAILLKGNGIVSFIRDGFFFF
jgi:hypothetical protein